MSKQFATWGPGGTIRDGDLDWQKFGVCQDADPDLFFGPDDESSAERRNRETEAKSYCEDCPVITDCRKHALAAPEKSGVWAGLNESERHTIRLAELPRRKPAKPPVKSFDLVPAIGTRRRLRALAWAGYGIELVAARSGVPIASVSSARKSEAPRIARVNADRIADAYVELLLELPEPASPRPRMLAAERGWDGPDAWSGVDMDDPDARPHQTANAA